MIARLLPFVCSTAHAEARPESRPPAARSCYMIPVIQENDIAFADNVNCFEFETFCSPPSRNDELYAPPHGTRGAHP
jgi:hypothetical protein